MAGDITQVILQDILKISSSLLREYSSVGDQLIYLILIPSLIILMFVWAFSGWITGEHPRFRILLSIVSYIFIIYSGWYGSFMVPIIVRWFVVLLAVGFIFFIMTKVIHPIRGPGIYKLSGAIGRRIKDVTVGKSKQIEALEKQESEVRGKIKSLEKQLSDPKIQANPNLVTYYQMQKQQYVDLLREIQSKQESI